MKVDLKRMASAIKSKSENGNGPGKPKTKAEIEAYQKDMAKKGKGWDPKTNRIYDLVGGATGKEMQYEGDTERNPMNLKTFEAPSIDKMLWGWEGRGIGGDRTTAGIDRPKTFKEVYNREPTDEELFNQGLKRNPQSGDLIEMKPGDIVNIGKIPYIWDKGRTIGKTKNKMANDEVNTSLLKTGLQNVENSKKGSPIANKDVKKK